MGMFGLVGSESKSDEQIWQQQLTATDQGTAIRSGGSVLGASSVFLGQGSRLNTGLEITGAKGPVTLNVGDTTGAGVAALGSALQSSLAKTGENIKAALESLGPLAESKQTGGQSTYLKYIVVAAVVVLAMWLLPKFWR